MKTRIKVISLLGVLAIVIIVAEFVYASFADAGEDFTRGFEEGYNTGRSVGLFDGSVDYLTTYVSVRAQEGVTPDTLHNSAMGLPVPYLLTGVHTAYVPSPAGRAFLWVIFVVSLLFLGSLFYLFRLLVDVSKGRVFTKLNVKRLRVFAYSFALSGVCLLVGQWLQHAALVGQLVLPGYEVVLPFDVDFSSIVIILLLTEVFAAGVMLKEEQDLTI